MMKKTIIIINILLVIGRLNLYGQSVDSLIIQGIRLCNEHLDSAQIIFNRVLKIDPYNTRALVAKLDCYQKHKEVDYKMEIINDLIHKDSTKAEYYFIRGSIFNERNDSNCINDYLKGLQIDSNNHDALYNIGIYYFNNSVYLTDSIKVHPEKEILLKDQNRYYLLKAQIYMEKAYNLIKNKPSSNYMDNTIGVEQQILINIYNGLKMEDKRKEMELKRKNHLR
jgi:tetratricopeptide (TPR) repeat protein